MLHCENLNFYNDVESDTNKSELNNKITKCIIKQVYNKNNKYDNEMNQNNNVCTHTRKFVFSMCMV